jgi:hypothetical protein
MEPTTAEDWMAVANDRAMDAEAIKEKQPNSVGSVMKKKPGFYFSLSFPQKLTQETRFLTFLPLLGKKDIT